MDFNTFQTKNAAQVALTFQSLLEIRLINLISNWLDATIQMDFLGHDGDSLGINGAQIGVLEQTNQVSLTGLLKSHNSRALEARITLEVLSDLSDQMLKGHLADQQLTSGLLVAIDLSELQYQACNVEASSCNQ